jgi:hypothetical protein
MEDQINNFIFIDAQSSGINKDFKETELEKTNLF